MLESRLAGLVTRILDQSQTGELTRRLADLEAGQRLGPLAFPEATRPAVVAALARLARAPILWLVPHPDDARAAAQALASFVSEPDRVFVLAAPDALPYERVAWDPVTRELRLAALGALYRWRHGQGQVRPPIIVAPMRAGLVKTMPPDAYDAGAVVVTTGDPFKLTDFAARMLYVGYEMVPTVTEPGQMARRGGIVDIYPPTERRPVRIEWFGDAIESLRRFDPVDQRSQSTLDSLLVVPAAEALAWRGPDAATAVGETALGRLHPLAESELRRFAQHLADGHMFPGIEFFGPLLHPEGQTALDHLPEAGWIVTDSIEGLVNAAEAAWDQAAAMRAEQIEAGELPDDWPFGPLAPPAALDSALARHPTVVLGTLGGVEQAAELAAQFGAPARFGGRVDEAVESVVKLTAEGRSVVVVSRQAPRLAELLTEAGLPTAAMDALAEAPGPGGLALIHGILGDGWTLGRGLGETVLLTDGEIFGWRVPHRRRPGRGAEAAQSVDFFSEFVPGDFVVHIEHGIGLFKGIQRMQVGDVERDYLHIEYAQADSLYVPTHQADRVTRYVGVGEHSPPVTRLGTADWERAKARARRAIEDMAEELLSLYAQREVARRQAFVPDTAWQAEMEAAFPYVETEDQLRAIEAVKADMESDRPMDRLVVGDVGFGKTEVALRAAFKAVMEGKQVAVLVPTTVLAQQHYETFRQRLAAFPVRVDVLSRFRSRAEQKDTLEGVASKGVDIVIGTHRLLSEDVTFADLGLLIVDEEHRFGVRHKERLRALKAGVDTLTLTATPIPRTMHMALSGLRDLTTIDTPPEERLPVATHVGPYDETVVRQAIRRELGRQGQVFYVYNRVQGIEMVAQKVTRLSPEARVRVAHGQMREDELAESMLAFAAGIVDVLVCTSIIESGLDIPNANTLIVERADRFGLAQLHQLRGRVGRGPARAYAYFLYPLGMDLADEAAERLAALAEATNLGAGFRLAMRDMEIRGAGEILGGRQHGHVTAVGLDLYTRLLAESIKNLRADEPAPADRLSAELEAVDPGPLPTVDLPLDAYLPDDYVAEMEIRTRLYRRMAAADSLDSVGAIGAELRDRFGPAPPAATRLLAVLRLRVLARLAGAESVGRAGNHAAVQWPEDFELPRQALLNRLEQVRVGRRQISVPLEGSPELWLARLEEVLTMSARLSQARLTTPAQARSREGP